MNEQKNLLKAVGLIRLSTAEQAVEGRAGIDRQKNDIAVAARVHGLEVTRVVEVVESGTKVRGQADFQQIFRELKSGAVDGVVCSNLDRLVRPDRFEDFAVFDHFRSNRKKIWTPGEMVDPSSQGGFLTSGFRGMLAGLERMLIVSRTTSGKEELRKRGWHPNGDQILPRGVGVERVKEGKRTVGMKWFYKEPDSSRVRRAYELLLAGMSYNAIAETIGGGWTDTGITRAMANTLWYGVRTFPPTADRREPMERRVIPESEALVSYETWTAARDIMLGRKKAWGARKRMPRFLLAGLLRCSCGKPYYVRANARRDGTRTQEHYYCSSHFPGHEPKCGARSLQRVALDHVVTDILKQRFRDPEFLLWLVKQSERHAEVKTDAAKLERQIAGIEAKRVRVVDGWQDGVITKADFMKRTAALDQQARELRTLLPSKAPVLDARRTVKAIAQFFAGFEDQPFEDQRRMLRTAFKEFRVQNGAIPGWTMNGDFLGSLDRAKVGPNSKSLHSRRCLERASESRTPETRGCAAACARRRPDPCANRPANVSDVHRAGLPESAPVRRTRAARAAVRPPAPCLARCSLAPSVRDDIRSLDPSPIPPSSRSASPRPPDAPTWLFPRRVACAPGASASRISLRARFPIPAIRLRAIRAFRAGAAPDRATPAGPEARRARSVVCAARSRNRAPVQARQS